MLPASQPAFLPNHCWTLLGSWQAGEHHFCGKIMSASQHSNRKRFEQLLQEFSNRHKTTSSRSRAQASSNIRWGRGRKAWEEGRRRRREHPDMLTSVSLDYLWLTAWRGLLNIFSVSWHLLVQWCSLRCQWDTGCSWGRKGTELKDPLDSKSFKHHCCFLLAVN